MKAKVLPKTARIGRWGFCNTLRGKHFSGFEFFLLPSRVHARPSDSSEAQTVDRILAI